MNYFQLQQPLDPAIMDLLLAQGYYRMRQTLFTTSATINDAGTVIHVIWARVRLDGYTPTKHYRELSRRNSRFTLSLHDARIDDSIDALYARYAASVDFDAPETVSSFLMGETDENFFPARMWLVHDAGRLVAVGYFDEGRISAAGILNFYDPDYKKYSLGKWLYLEGVRHAAETGRVFFYPGYIAMSFPKFDYKLVPGRERIELWDVLHKEWIPYERSIHAQQFKG